MLILKIRFEKITQKQNKNKNKKTLITFKMPPYF